MKLADYMDAINVTKKDIISTSDSAEAAEKLFPAFITKRMMSYHVDSILLINEINIRGLEAFGITNQMTFDFLQNVTSRKRRFARLAKQSKASTAVQAIIETLGYSDARARETVEMLTEEKIEEINIAYNSREGGRV